MRHRRRLITNPSDIIEAIRRFRSETILTRLLMQVPPTSTQYRKADMVDEALCNLADELSGKSGTLETSAHGIPKTDTE